MPEAEAQYTPLGPEPLPWSSRLMLSLSTHGRVVNTYTTIMLVLFVIAIIGALIYIAANERVHPVEVPPNVTGLITTASANENKSVTPAMNTTTTAVSQGDQTVTTEKTTLCESTTTTPEVIISTTDEQTPEPPTTLTTTAPPEESTATAAPEESTTTAATDQVTSTNSASTRAAAFSITTVTSRKTNVPIIYMPVNASPDHTDGTITNEQKRVLEVSREIVHDILTKFR